MGANVLISSDVMQDFLNAYIPLVLRVGKTFLVNLKDARFSCDHLGFQAMSAAEFDASHELLDKYAKLIHAERIHERRNNVYYFNEPFIVDDIVIPKIEVFEPKPDAKKEQLRSGIEHIAFFAKDYDKFLVQCKKKGVLIDKTIDMANSKFFKTKIVNTVELEFRNDALGEWN